jgi:hypothetical protein
VVQEIDDGVKEMPWLLVAPLDELIMTVEHHDAGSAKLDRGNVGIILSQISARHLKIVRN